MRACRPSCPSSRVHRSTAGENLSNWEPWVVELLHETGYGYLLLLSSQDVLQED